MSLAISILRMVLHSLTHWWIVLYMNTSSHQLVLT